MSRALVAVTVAAAVTLAPAGPASAGIWQLTDGFEPSTNPESRWSWEAEGFCGGPNYTSTLWTPRTGTGVANFKVSYVPDWCAIGRTIRLTPVVTHPGSTCTAGVWARLNDQRPQLNVEVINPSTWTYLALKKVTSSGSWTFHSVSWTAQRPDVVVRFALVARSNGPYFAEVALDDVVVQCAY
ncbi:hypothetical protein HerbRD11066_17930 [Herbidospora sp. RD11066]